MTEIIYDSLKMLNISFRSVQHSPASTIEACKEIEKELNAPFCKNLFLCNRQETEFFLLLMVEDKPFKTKDVSKTIGKARLSFGKEEKLFEFLKCKGEVA